MILSSTGLQQGDPLGPFLFALGVQNMISKLKSKFNTWYLDDGSAADKADIVLSDLKHTIKEGEKFTYF